MDDDPTATSGRARGLANLRPWKPGQSGNPSGGTKGAPRFRAGCRDMAERLYQELESRDLTKLTVEQLLAALETMANYGGYLPGDKLAAAEATRWRVVATILSIETLSEATRNRLLNEIGARQQEALAEPDDEAVPEAEKP